MKRLVVLLGDYYHPKEWSKSSLHRVLTLLNEKESMECAYIETDQLLEELKKNPDGVILFKENRLNPVDDSVDTWMTEEIGKAISNYVEQGGGWLAWHSGLASYPQESSYTRMLRGHFEYHPNHHSPVKYSSVKESDLFGPVSFEINDEHYFVKVNKKDTNIFLTSESGDGYSTAGWYHNHGKGRVCCLTPAHNKEELLDENFTSLLAKTIGWVGE
ncbi:trehalose utilization [Bacillus lacus]|uniref:Trehalose utilization n=1 Tax=Metabacillus lacus TaxID=1983721 RepID=A0A7X2J2M1_9BACI|nr:ThuA domain-containing protein [Metabacillus lacus]MRX74184.1 trehalose utilization [Metabacillus lacus]